MPLIRPLHPGQQIGDYELSQTLHEGPLATTWLARGPVGEVVIKTIAVVNLDDPEMEDAFLVQTERASQVRHPGVAHLLISGLQAGHLFAIFEYIDGYGLDAMLKTIAQEPPPLEVGLRLCLELCEATAAIHESDAMAHRALAPNNVLLRRDGTVALLDLGVGAVLSRSTSSTTFRHMVGKFSYLSPEQLWSRPVDVRSDVFSLGLLCCELLTGRHPFRGRHERETTANILSPTTEPLLPDGPAALPAPVAAWLCQAMAKSPADRFISAVAQRDALLQVIADSPPLASTSELAAHIAQRLTSRSLPVSTLSSVPPPPLPSSLTNLIEAPDPGPPSRRSFAWLGLASLLAVAGLVGWRLWH